jgi:hypothetical protein
MVWQIVSYPAKTRNDRTETKETNKTPEWAENYNRS